MYTQNCIQLWMVMDEGAIFDSAHILLALCISELIRMRRVK